MPLCSSAASYFRRVSFTNPGMNVTITTPPLSATRFRTSSGTLRGLAVSDDGATTWTFHTSGLHALYCRAVAVTGSLPTKRVTPHVPITPEEIISDGMACEAAGAQGITCHLRKDRRHIQDSDVRRLLEAQSLVRDLVNTPTEHMGPQELADAAAALANEFGAEFSVIEGDDLLTQTVT